MGNTALVEIKTLSRRPARAFPRTVSDSPSEYPLAVSKKLIPASRQMSMRRVASFASVLPHAPKKSPLPPSVIGANFVMIPVGLAKPQPEYGSRPNYGPR